MTISFVLTWLHAARRDLLVVHPRGDQDRPLTGVFSTRAPHRPNPIGLHEIIVVDKMADAVLVRGLEAIDGTPVVDLKPVLEPRGLLLQLTKRPRSADDKWILAELESSGHTFHHGK